MVLPRKIITRVIHWSRVQRGKCKNMKMHRDFLPLLSHPIRCRSCRAGCCHPEKSLAGRCNLHNFEIYNTIFFVGRAANSRETTSALLKSVAVMSGFSTSISSQGRAGRTDESRVSLTGRRHHPTGTLCTQRKMHRLGTDGQCRRMLISTGM